MNKIEKALVETEKMLDDIENQLHYRPTTELVAKRDLLKKQIEIVKGMGYGKHLEKYISFTSNS